MNDPRDLWNGMWERLRAGVNDPKAPARHVALATRAAKGVGARMVVLRGADAEDLNLTFYTHRHARKVSEIAADPFGEVLLWDSSTLFQARLSVEFGVSQGSAALWATLGDGARLNYATSFEPGALLEKPTAPSDTGTKAFAVITAKITAVDLLSLASLPHKRAQFSAADGFQGQWVAP